MTTLPTLSPSLLTTLAPTPSFTPGTAEDEDDPMVAPPPPPQFEQAVLLWYSTSMFVVAGLFFVGVQYLELRRPHWYATIKVFDVSLWTALYFGFSVTLVVYNKWLISVWEGGFQFPMFMTFVHMSEKWTLTWFVVRFCRRRAEVPKISRGVWWIYAVPVGATTALDVAASNASFYYVSISLYTVVKSTSLVFVLAFSVLYSIQRCEARLVLVTAVICAGVLLASYSDPNKFDGIGFSLVFLAAALGGYRWTLTEILMAKIGTKMNSLMTIYTIAPASVLVLMPFAAWLEGSALLASKFYRDPTLFLLAVLNVVMSGIFAFALIYVELAVLHRTSSLSLGVISYLKQIFQIVLSVLIFHDELSPLNVVGVIITFTGMIYYSTIKSFAKPSSAGASSTSSSSDHTMLSSDDGSSSTSVAVGELEEDRDGYLKTHERHGGKLKKSAIAPSGEDDELNHRLNGSFAFVDLEEGSDVRGKDEEQEEEEEGVALGGGNKVKKSARSRVVEIAMTAFPSMGITNGGTGKMKKGKKTRGDDGNNTNDNVRVSLLSGGVEPPLALMDDVQSGDQNALEVGAFREGLSRSRPGDREEDDEADDEDLTSAPPPDHPLRI